jgi:hypothetical protein
MKKINKKKTLAVILMFVTSQALAQYTIKKYSINNGSAKLSGGQYQVNASIGQVDASSQLSGANYSHNSGFWHENTDLIFKNGFE